MSRRRGQRRAGRPTVHLGDVATGSADNIRLIRTGELIEIGDLSGEARQPVTAHFTYFGARLRVNPNLTELDVVDLLEQADQVKVNDPKSMIMTKDYARAHIHPDDFDEFWALVKKHRQDTTGIMTTCWKILAGITANPTGGQSDSSDGQPGTKTSSQPGSSGQVIDLSARRLYLDQIAKVQARTGDDGQAQPINPAIALQLVTAAKARGIDLEAEVMGPSADATG